MVLLRLNTSIHDADAGKVMKVVFGSFGSGSNEIFPVIAEEIAVRAYYLEIVYYVHSVNLYQEVLWHVCFSLQLEDNNTINRMNITVRYLTMVHVNMQCQCVHLSIACSAVYCCEYLKLYTNKQTNKQKPIIRNCCQMFKIHGATSANFKY